MRSNLLVNHKIVSFIGPFIRSIPAFRDTWHLPLWPSGVAARLSRRELLIGLGYASIAVPGIVCSCQAVSKTAATRSSGSQHLHFPAVRAIGTVYALARQDRRRAKRERENPMEHWERLGAARGKVVLSPGARLWLELNTHGLNEPEVMEARHCPMVYRLSLEAGVLTPADRWFVELERFNGLRELDLRNAPEPPANLAWLQALPTVTRLWLPEPVGALERERMVAQVARAGLVEVGRQVSRDSIHFRRKPVDK